MVAPDLRRSVLRTAPLITIAALVVWVARDILAVSEPRVFQGLAAFLVFGAIAVLLATLPGWAWMQTSGLVALGVSYFGAHVIVVGLDVVPLVSFLTLLIVNAEIRVLAERFASLYARPLLEDQRRVLDVALVRAAFRLGFAASLAILIPLLAANLAVGGVIPARTIPTAVIFAAVLVVVIALVAILPTLERRSPS